MARMGTSLSSLILGLAVAIAFLCTAQGRVFVVVPNVLNVDEMETVSVLVTGTTSGRPKVTLTMTSASNNQLVHHSDQHSVHRDSQTIINIKVLGDKLGEPDSKGNHYVHLRIQCKDSKNFDKTASILVSKRTGTVFIQTDKPVYSPKQTVTIRVFALDEKRRAADIPVKVEVKNPQGIIVSRKMGQTETGIFVHTVNVVSRPLHGFWSVVASYGRNYSESREKYIEIKKYVLPHFQVTAELPEYISSVNKPVSGKIKARYSFDAEVVGKARVEFRTLQDGQATFLKRKHYTLTLGESDFTLTSADMTRLNMADLEQNGAKLQVVVNVTETSTGISESYVGHIAFVTSPYIISFKGTQNYFSPSLPFEVKVTARHVSGAPLGGTVLEIEAVGNDGKPLSKNSQSASVLRTNSDGEGWYLFDVPHNLQTITIKVNVKDNAKEFKLVAKRSVMSGYIRVKVVGERVLTPGQSESFEATMTDGNSFNTLHYMLITGGRIQNVGYEQRQGGATIVTFNSQIDPELAPSARLVAYYFSNGNDLVATSILLPVEQKCHTEATIRTVGCMAMLRPGEHCNLAFTGTPQGNLVTMAVDKAVYFMNGTNKFTRKSYLDEFETRDIGCGSGGGANAHDVFKWAGLAIISDSYTHAKRTSDECSPTISRKRRSAAGQAEGKLMCCQEGELYANTTTNILYSSSERFNICFTEATKKTTTMCKNEFGRCCLLRAKQRAQQSDAQRSAQDDDGDEDPEFIMDEEGVTIRSDFKESWLMSSNEKIPLSGTFIKSVTMPSSITTWVFDSVVISKNEGMCVAPPMEQLVRKDVFLKLQLPHTARLGEQFVLAATVYNLKGWSQRVKVGLLGAVEFCSRARTGRMSYQLRTVERTSSWTAQWPIVPTQIGEIKITVKLYSAEAPDIVVRTLNVVPAGDLVVAPMLQVTQDPSGRKSTGRQWSGRMGSLSFIANRDLAEKAQVTDIPLLLPAESITDTGAMKITFLGDIMTPIVEGELKGTEKHLHKPSGCGEQTMARVGPTIFTTFYLRQQGKLTGPLERDAQTKIDNGQSGSHMDLIAAAGIKHMLQYRKSNGGYSVWAGAKWPTRLWLTAFTLKTFSKARSLTQLDDNLIKTATNWLMSQQLANRMFPHKGPWHADMTGGSTKSQLKITAYTYIAILEAGKYQAHKNSVDLAMNEIARLARTQSDPYTLAMVTYTLAKHGHTDATMINQRLMLRARNVTGTQPTQTYWPTDITKVSELGSEIEVETAAYGLLAQVTLGHVLNSNPIVEWLLRQRYGGQLFRTTQSTVMALQALTEYSRLANRDTLNMRCTLSYPASKYDDSEHFTLNDGNRLQQQMHDLTNRIGETLNVRCTGTGVIHTSVESTYYSAKARQDNCVYNVTAKAIPVGEDSMKEMTIQVTTILTDEDQKQFMPMIEIGLGTGYEPVQKSLDLLKESSSTGVDEIEVNDRFVVLYMDKIPSEEPLKLSFTVERKEEVEKMVPVPVKVYGYYEPDKTACSTFYHPHGDTDEAMLDVQCKADEDTCRCLENQCPACYGYSSLPGKGGMEQPIGTKAELQTLACSTNVHYVFKAEYDRVIEDNGMKKHTFTIEKVIKPGTESELEVKGQTRTFEGALKCRSCEYDPGRKYLIMGKDRRNKKDTTNPDYFIDQDTYIVPMYKKKECQDMSQTDKTINTNTRKFARDLERNGCGL